MRILLATILLGALLATGCARSKVSPSPRRAAAVGETSSAAAPPRPQLIVTPVNALAGRVAKVNVNSRFVVVNFAGGRMPSLGQILPVYRGGLKVGELRMSGPQLEENLVADLVAGEVQAGDDVREN